MPRIYGTTSAARVMRVTATAIRPGRLTSAGGHSVEDAASSTSDYHYVVAPSTWMGSVSPDARKPKSAHQWVVANPRVVARFHGKWIAVTADGIQASADDFDEVFDLAEAGGIRAPLVFKVPKRQGGPRAVSARLNS